MPPPVVVAPEDIPTTVLATAAASSSAAAAPPAPKSPAICMSIPAPIHPTTEEVEQWVTENFKPLENISTKVPPEIGESVLWRGVKVGKHGGASTKVEYFNGTVHHVQVDPTDNECYVYID